MRKFDLSMLFTCLAFSGTLVGQNIFPPFGNAGIGTNTPIFPLQIVPGVGAPNANAQGWERGIILNGQSTLYWDGAPNTTRDYFMAHASSNPMGDFYQGFSVGTGPTAPVTYVSKVYVTSPPAYIPDGTTQIFKNLIIDEGGGNRRVGVNLPDPARSMEVFHATDPQLRLTRNPGALGGGVVQGLYTDFLTTNLGHLNIIPRNNGAARNVGIDLPIAPSPFAAATQKLDVNGNARLRSVPTTPADYLMLGLITPGGIGANDITFRKLAFTGSSTQVLLGNGTWGTIPSSAGNANNGLSVNGTFVQLGQNCPSVGNPAALLGNREIPLNTFNLYFSGQGVPTSNAIGLGYSPCGAAMPAKFSTFQKNTGPVTVPTIAGSFINQDLLNGSGAITGVQGISDQAQPSGNISNIGGNFRGANAPVNIGVNGDAAGNSGSTQSIGGQFTSQITNPGSNIGVVTRVIGGNTSNIGVVGSGTGGANSYGVQATSGGAITANYGVTASAVAGIDSYGVLTSAGFASNANYGVKASASGGVNSYGIYASNAGASPNHWAGWFDGDVWITGSGWVNSGIMITSDKRFKKNINEIEKVSEKIAKLKGYTYEFKTDEFQDRRFPQEEQIGFIAQELKEVFPQLVKEGKDGYMAVNYIGMIPVLLEAIKEQQKETEELKEMVKNLTSSNSSNNNGSEEKKISSVTLNDAQSIILEQNVPNPFAEQTSIAYTLTDGVQKAQMLFYNAEGKLINSSELKPVVGAGQLNVFASDLSNGVYTYTLVVDGKVIETKRMVKSK